MSKRKRDDSNISKYSLRNIYSYIYTTKYNFRACALVYVCTFAYSRQIQENIYQVICAMAKLQLESIHVYILSFTFIWKVTS